MRIELSKDLKGRLLKSLRNGYIDPENFPEIKKEAHIRYSEPFDLSDPPDWYKRAIEICKIGYQRAGIKTIPVDKKLKIFILQALNDGYIESDSFPSLPIPPLDLFTEDEQQELLFAARKIEY